MIACVPTLRNRAAPATAVMVAILTALHAGPVDASSFRTILVDDQVSDWSGIAPLHSDPTGDHGGLPIDFRRIYIANDDRFVYLRFDVGTLVNLQSLTAPLRIYLDTDLSTATGFPVQGIGSDLLVECALGIGFYEQTASLSYAVPLGPGRLAAYQGPTAAANEFELRLARNALLPIRGQPAFPAAGFRLAFEVGGGAGDVAPDVPGSLAYTIATGTPAPPPDNDLARFDRRHVRILSYNVRFDGFVGPDSMRFRRILRAIQPDLIGFQELFSTSAADVARRLDRDLPLAGGGRWQAAKGARGQVTASRYPMTVDFASPALELVTRIALPRPDYDTDLHLVNSHFKCCGSLGSIEDDQRQDAADAIVAWFRSVHSPSSPIPWNTPIVHLGDFNLVGGPQPLLTLVTGDIQNQGAYGADHPPDWDGTALARAAPVHTDGMAAYTWRNDNSHFVPGKLDYLLYTDAVASAGNRFVLNTLDMSAAKLAALGLVSNDTHEASDHLPTVLDLMPEARSVSGTRLPADVLRRFQGVPNPFAQTVQVHFELAARVEITVAIHDLLGRRVRTLMSGVTAAGPYTLPWDGRDEKGHAVRSGLYFARLVLGVAGAPQFARAIKLAMVP